MSFAKFKKDMKKIELKIEKAASATVRAAALDLLGNIVKDTPVDTGVLRGNWQASIDYPATGQLANTSFDIGAAKSALSKYQSGKTIYLANNMEYAEHIEYGTSKVRPYAMVRRNLKSFNQYLDKAARQNRIK